MHSLLFLCARRLVGHHPATRQALAVVPTKLYVVLFQAAFLEERTLALQDLVETWPYPVLSFHHLLEGDLHHLLGGKPSKLCVQAVILALGRWLRGALEEPRRDTGENRCRLKVLDVTGLQDDDTKGGSEWMSLWSCTVALAKACLEVSKHHQEHLKSHSTAGRVVALQPPRVEVRADLFVNSTSFNVLRGALQTPGPLLLKCRDFHAEGLPVASIVALLDLLEPHGVRRVDLRFNNLGLTGLCAVLPHLARFPDLSSLKLPYSNVNVRRVTTEDGLQCLATQLERLASLKELNLGSSRLSGKLRQLLGNLRSPLESLELAACFLLPSDFSFLSRSIHAPALKKLDLSGHDFSHNLLQHLQHLLEVTSASLLHLDLMECQLTDASLESLLPVLCRCSHLRCLGLFGNPITTSGLKTLVQKTVVLLDLTLVVYPYPSDCYTLEPPRQLSPVASEEVVDKERLAALSAEVGRMLGSSGRSHTVWTTSLCQHNALDYFAL
ncbi:LRC14 protein, partial [Jacana jacana]|nr:LRC14 protein [Jacana jacana]